ncbi:MAG: ThuA domain-containing protein [Planctomycetota bacterium]
MFAVALFGCAVGEKEQPHRQLKLLILNGLNNHPWEQTTSALEKLYRESGRFDVVITNDPSTLTAEKLSGFDVVVSNWTNYPSEERVWGERAEKALMDFVRDGKGFVVFHAASSCFHTWEDYQKLVGATWGKNTGHGNMHSFKVTIEDGNHPIMDGIKRFRIHDELWHRMEVQPDAHILCRAYSSPEHDGTGDDEPIAFTTSFGKGRGFNLVLGHDTNAMDNPYWKLLMLRGTEWAAAGRVTIDIPFNSQKVFDEIGQYQPK